MRFYKIIILSLFTLSLSAQSFSELGFNFQVYPTGIIPGVTYVKSLGEKSTFLVRIGHNNFDHRDLGVQDEEIGSGWGGSIGYQRYFASQYKGWLLTLKNDFWWNDVDWANENGDSGTTSITVIQPTIGLGHTLAVGGDFYLTPALSFGFEWNVRTNGEPTGDGAIVLIGVTIGKRW